MKQYVHPRTSVGANSIENGITHCCMSGHFCDRNSLYGIPAPVLLLPMAAVLIWPSNPINIWMPAPLFFKKTKKTTEHLDPIMSTKHHECTMKRMSGCTLNAFPCHFLNHTSLFFKSGFVVLGWKNSLIHFYCANLKVWYVTETFPQKTSCHWWSGKGEKLSDSYLCKKEKVAFAGV